MRKRKKLARPIAWLLTVCMLLSLLPAGALAAIDASGPAAGNPLIKFNLMASKDGYTHKTFSEGPLSTIPYMGTAAQAGTNIEDAVKTVNGAFQDDTALGTEPLTVHQGDTFYLALKMDISALLGDGDVDDYKGLLSYTALYRYDPTAFVINATDETDEEGYYSGPYLNPLLSGTDIASSNVINHNDYRDYFSTGTITRGTLIETESDKKTPTGYNLLSMIVDRSPNNYISNAGTWDIMIPVTVQANATPGTYEFVLADDTYDVGGAKSIAMSGGKWKNGAPNESPDSLRDNYASNTITIKIINPSASLAGAEDSYLNDTVVNNKDSLINGAKDLFVVPDIAAGDIATGETVFQAKDTVVFYADKNGAVDTSSMIGDAKIVLAGSTAEDANFYGDEYAGKLIAVLEKDAGASGTASFLPQGGGTYWINRISPPVEAEDPDHKGETIVTESFTEGLKWYQVIVPAEELYYTEDKVVFTAAPDAEPPLGSEENPVEVKIGDTVSDVLAKVSASLPAGYADVKVDYDPDDATADHGTVTVALDWANGTFKRVSGSSYADVTTLDDHSQLVEIKLLFPDTTDTPAGPAKQGGSDQATYYGAVIYAKVMPNAADYLVTKGTGDAPSTITLSGKSLAAFNNDADTITFYSAADATSGVVMSKATAVQSGETVGCYVIPEAFGVPEVGEKIYITFKEADSAAESSKAALTVTGGSLEVEEDKDLTDGGVVELEASDALTVESLLSDPLFSNISVKISGGHTATVSVENSANLTFLNAKDETVSFDGTAPGSYRLKYVIPAGKTDVLEGETEGKDYVNTKSYAVYADLVVKYRITPVITEGSKKVTNAAYPSNDTIEFVDTAAGTGRGIFNGDQVNIYADADGKVLLDTVTAKVEGTAVKIETKKLAADGGTLYLEVFNNSRNVLASNLISVTYSAEPYVLTSVTPMADTTRTFDTQKYATWQSIYNELPTETTITYARFMDKGGINVIDPSTSKTMKVALIPMETTGAAPEGAVPNAVWAMGGNTEGSYAAVGDSSITNMTSDLTLYAKLDTEALTTAHIVVNSSLVASGVDTDFSLKIRTVEAQPESEWVTALDDITLTNHAFPVKDELSIAGIGEGAVLSIYTKNPDTAGNEAITPLISRTVTAEEASAHVLTVDQLNSLGGTFYITVSGKKDGSATLRSEAVAKRAAEEPYVIYSYSLATTSASFTTPTTQLNTIEAALPATLNVTVAHLTATTSASGEATNTVYSAESTTVITQDVASWAKSGGGALSADDIKTEGSIAMVPTPAEGDLTVTKGETVIAVEAANEATGISPTMPEFTVTLNKLPTLPIPEFKIYQMGEEPSPTDTDYIIVTNDKGVDNDQIQIRTTNAALLEGTVDIVYFNQNNDQKELSDLAWQVQNPLADNGAFGTVSVTKGNPANFTGLSANQVDGGVSVTFKAEGYNSATKAVPIAAEPAAVQITELKSGKSLHLQAGAIADKDGVVAYMPSSVTAMLEKPVNGETEMALNINAVQGWTLEKETSANVWTPVTAAGDITAALNTPGNYRMVADVVIPDGTDIEMPDPALSAIVPVEVQKKGDLPLKLTSGNSDLYGDGTAPTDAIVLKRLGELYPTLSGDALKAMAAEHEYDLVFYYKYENYTDHVKPYVESNAGSWENAISMFGDTNFSTWQSADASHRTVTATEIPISENGRLYTTGYNGSAEAVTHAKGRIEPMHSNNSNDYFTYDRGGAGSITRGVESYRINYTVTDELGNVYVATRDVKLRYRVGDVNLDGFTDSTDATFINAFSQSKAAPFRNEDGSANTDLCASVCDFNYDGFGDSTDATFIQAYSQSKMEMPLMRW